MTFHTSNTPPQTNSGSDEDPLDLKNTFSHPAGLFTAQYLVRAIIQTAVEIAQRSAEGSPPTLGERIESATLLSSIPSHLVQPGALDQLLAFRCPEPAAMDGDMLRENTQYDQNNLIPSARQSLSAASLSSDRNQFSTTSLPYSGCSNHSASVAYIHTLPQASASSALSSGDLFPRLHHLEHQLPQPFVQSQSLSSEDPHSTAAHVLSALARGSLQRPYTDLTPANSFPLISPSAQSFPRPSDENRVSPLMPSPFAQSLISSSGQSHSRLSDKNRVSSDEKMASSLIASSAQSHSQSPRENGNRASSLASSSAQSYPPSLDQSGNRTSPLVSSFAQSHTVSLDGSRRFPPLSSSNQCHARLSNQPRPSSLMSSSAQTYSPRSGKHRVFSHISLDENRAPYSRISPFQSSRASDESRRIFDNSKAVSALSQPSRISDESKGNFGDSRVFLQMSPSVQPSRTSDASRTFSPMSSTHLSRPSGDNRNLSPMSPLQLPRTASEGISTAVPSATLSKTSIKRKAASDEKPAAKKPKVDKPKARRTVKSKPEKETSAAKLSQDLWMRILEYTPPRFLSKVRLVNKELKSLVDEFDSIYVNCRKENFGYDMPSPPEGITERQYSNLLEGKGCQDKDCEKQDKTAERTHWSWSKRWCMPCWRKNIVREDRLFKVHAQTYPRTALTKLLECIPVGMQDSFVKPHDYVEETTPLPRGAPRLYKVYLEEDVARIFEEYEALTPEPYQEDPEHTAEQKSAALAAHQALMDKLEDKRNEFFAQKKAKNDQHMAKVIKIEQGIKLRRGIISRPHTDNRNARKALFTNRASEDLPYIPKEFVQQTKAYKAATRVFRDGGSERGWQLLKPKIQKEWEIKQAHTGGGQTANTEGLVQVDVVADEELNQSSQIRSVSPESANYNSSRASIDPTHQFQARPYPGEMFHGPQRSSLMEHLSQRYPSHMSHSPHNGFLSHNNQPRFPSPVHGSYSASNGLYPNSAPRQHTSMLAGFGPQLSSSDMRRSDSDNTIAHRSNTLQAMSTPRPSSAGSVDRFSSPNVTGPSSHPHLQNNGCSSSTNPYNHRVPISSLLGPQTPHNGQFDRFDDFSQSFPH